MKPLLCRIVTSFKRSTSGSVFTMFKLCYYMYHLKRQVPYLNYFFKLKVPISLSIRVSSFRGTARVYIKPPPSDQLWYGFTFMPEIDFDLQSSIGEHKITSGHIALFLINRFKVWKLLLFSSVLFSLLF